MQRGGDQPEISVVDRLLDDYGIRSSRRRRPSPAAAQAYRDYGAAATHPAGNLSDTYSYAALVTEAAAVS